MHLFLAFDPFALQLVSFSTMRNISFKYFLTTAFPNSFYIFRSLGMQFPPSLEAWILAVLAYGKCNWRYLNDAFFRLKLGSKQMGKKSWEYENYTTKDFPFFALYRSWKKLERNSQKQKLKFQPMPSRIDIPMFYHVSSQQNHIFNICISFVTSF